MLLNRKERCQVLAWRQYQTQVPLRVPRTKATRSVHLLPCCSGSKEGVYVQRTVAKVEWGRPLGTGWHGNLGVTWQQVRGCTAHGVRLCAGLVAVGPLMLWDLIPVPGLA